MKKKKPKTTAQLRKLAWNAFSKWYRQSRADAFGNVRCYTCLYIHPWKEIHSGHAIPGRHNAVLFDEEIIRPQCFQCNSKLPGCKGGNYQVFSAKLIREYAEEKHIEIGQAFEWWERKLEHSRSIVKFTRQDLLDKIADFETRPDESRK